MQLRAKWDNEGGKNDGCFSKSVKRANRERPGGIHSSELRTAKEFSSQVCGQFLNPPVRKWAKRVINKAARSTAKATVKQLLEEARNEELVFLRELYDEYPYDYLEESYLDLDYGELAYAYEAGALDPLDYNEECGFPF